MSALPQTLGEMRAMVVAARVEAVRTSRSAAGRHVPNHEDMRAGDEAANEMAVEFGFLTPEGDPTILLGRAMKNPKTAYSIDPAELAVVRRVLYDAEQARYHDARAVATLELTAAQIREEDSISRRHQAAYDAAVAASGINPVRILSLVAAEMDERARAQREDARRNDRRFQRRAA